MITERMQLSQYEKIFTDTGVVEIAKYAHIIERDGVIIQVVPHRLVVDRTQPNVTQTLPDGTVKTNAEIATEIDV
jgi:hypothetical protein